MEEDDTPFEITKRDGKTYVNGNELLSPYGEPSVPLEQLREAIRRVVNGEADKG